MYIYNVDTKFQSMFFFMYIHFDISAKYFLCKIDFDRKIDEDIDRIIIVKSIITKVLF